MLDFNGLISGGDCSMSHKKGKRNPVKQFFIFLQLSLFVKIWLGNCPERQSIIFILSYLSLYPPSIKYPLSVRLMVAPIAPASWRNTISIGFVVSNSP